MVPECESDDDCPDYRYCNLETQTCDDPCAIKRCGVNALCNATDHRAVCQCIAGYVGDPYVLCSKIFFSRVITCKDETIFSFVEFFIPRRHVSIPHGFPEA